MCPSLQKRLPTSSLRNTDQMEEKGLPNTPRCVSQRRSGLFTRNSSHLMRSRSIRVGILGCGRLAEHHLRFVAENPRAELAGLSDTDLARARSLAERYHVPHVFSSLTQMLESGTIDVLHVVTPPALHYQHACYAIDKGIHVFIEKPVAFSVDEVKDLYTRAAQKKVKICPDFLQLFHPIVEKISDLLADGQFGSVIHVESFMAVESALPELKEWPGTHWSFELPGGVLHNYITHPLYLTLNWIGRARNISVRSRSYGLLPQGLTDHLDVMIE